MKGSDIISTIHHLKMADEHMQSFIRDRPQALLTRLFKQYSKSINRMFLDLKSEPSIPPVVVAGINSELKSDSFTVPAINEKIALLPPEQRETVELLIDEILKGNEIKAVKA
jgi:hypothetical protein